MEISPKIKRLASKQSGYFTKQQAAENGVSPGSLFHFQQNGVWTNEGWGLFRFHGYENTIESLIARWALWSRDRKQQVQAIASHRTALAYYNIIDDVPEIQEFTVPEGFRKKAPSGVKLYKQDLKQHQMRKTGCFHVTSPVVTLQDMVQDSDGDQNSEFVREITERALLKELCTREEINKAGLGNYLPEEDDAMDKRIIMAARRAEEMHAASRYRKTFRDVLFSRSGFTLVELLVVIAIISILAGLLLPALSSTLATARQIACSNNVKQLAFGVMLYRDEYNGFYPALNGDNVDPNGCTALWWPNAVSAYIPVPGWKSGNEGYGSVLFRPGTVWACPEVSADEVMWGGGYGCNADGPMPLMKPWGRGYNKGNFMKRPNAMVILGDVRRYAAGADGGDQTWVAMRAPIWSSTDWVNTGSTQAAGRHQERANMSFQDGRVESILWDDLYHDKAKYFEWWH